MHRELNTKEEMSSILLPSSSTTLRMKKMVKVVVLAYELHACDYLGRRIIAQIQLELSLQRNWYQSFGEIEKNESFEAMLGIKIESYMYTKLSRFVHMFSRQ